MPSFGIVSQLTRTACRWLANTVAGAESGTPPDSIPLHDMATTSTPFHAAEVSVDSELDLRPMRTSLLTTGILAGLSAVGISFFMIVIPSPVRPPLELVEQRLRSQLVAFWRVSHLLGTWRDNFARQFNDLTSRVSRVTGQPTINYLPPPAQSPRFARRESRLTYYLSEALKALFVVAVVIGVWKGVAVFEGWIAAKGGAMIPEAL